MGRLPVKTNPVRPAQNPLVSHKMQTQTVHLAPPPPPPNFKAKQYTCEANMIWQVLQKCQYGSSASDMHQCGCICGLRKRQPLSILSWRLGGKGLHVDPATKHKELIISTKQCGNKGQRWTANNKTLQTTSEFK